MEKIKLIILTLNAFLLIGILNFSYSEEGKDQNKPTGKLSVGFVQTSGNSETSTLKFKFNYTDKGKIYRKYIDMSVLYGESKGKKNAEEEKFNGRFERRFLPFFAFWDLHLHRNPFKGYDYSIGTGPGLGVYLLKDENKSLSVSYYIYRVYNRLTDRYTEKDLGRKIERYFMHNIEQRFRIKLTPTVKIKEKLVYKITSRKRDDYFIDGYLALESNLTKRLTLEVSYTINYQNLPVENKLKRLDTVFMTSIGYKF